MLLGMGNCRLESHAVAALRDVLPGFVTQDERLDYRQVAEWLGHPIEEWNLNPLGHGIDPERSDREYFSGQFYAHAFVFPEVLRGIPALDGLYKLSTPEEQFGDLGRQIHAISSPVILPVYPLCSELNERLQVRLYEKGGLRALRDSGKRSWPGVNPFKACASCHTEAGTGTPKGPDMPFDDRAQFENELKTTGLRARLIDRLTTTNEQDVMPPISEQATPREKATHSRLRARLVEKLDPLKRAR
jgi:cytochrome c553